MCGQLLNLRLYPANAPYIGYQLSIRLPWLPLPSYVPSRLPLPALLTAVIKPSEKAHKKFHMAAFESLSGISAKYWITKATLATALRALTPSILFGFA